MIGCQFRLNLILRFLVDLGLVLCVVVSFLDVTDWEVWHGMMMLVIYMLILVLHLMHVGRMLRLNV